MFFTFLIAIAAFAVGSVALALGVAALIKAHRIEQHIREKERPEPQFVTARWMATIRGPRNRFEQRVVDADTESMATRCLIQQGVPYDRIERLEPWNGPTKPAA